jgi:hypothetical protein
MKKYVFISVQVFLCMCLTAAVPTPARACSQTGTVEPDAAQRLAAAYPDAHMLLEEGLDGLYLRIGDSRLLFSPTSGCPADPAQREQDAPLCTLFFQAYTAGVGGRHPVAGFEPGRCRSESLLKLLYGKDAIEAARETTVVMLAGERLKLSKRHGAARAMERVAAQLEQLMRESPEIRKYIVPTAGSFCWRTIEGSRRLSPHSFGIAVDLNVQQGLYWQWSKSGSQKQVERVRQDYPQAIVDAFEAEGFIWGGKWHSFDFMHFEYRPELLQPKRGKR